MKYKGDKNLIQKRGSSEFIRPLGVDETPARADVTALPVTVGVPH